MAALRGVVGRVEWAYYVAAAIEGYTVTRDAAGVWQLRATLVHVDAFKMAQRPLRFVAPHANGSWTWPIERFELVNGSITATLGAPL